MLTNKNKYYFHMSSMLSGFTYIYFHYSYRQALSADNEYTHDVNFLKT